MRKLAICAVLLAAVCAAVLGGAASASSAGNHQVFPDPAGDNQRAASNNYAADIFQVEVTVQDSGAAVFSVSLGDPRLFEGDEVQVWIDEDHNSNTGNQGFDDELIATGHSSGGTTFVFCEYTQITACANYPSGGARDRQSGSNHIIDFAFSFGVPDLRFFVRTIYTQPGGSTTLYDYAPNSGVFTFDTKADPDNDRIYGTADKCPTTAGGKFDSNHNGCPGPFSFMRERLVRATTGGRQPRHLWVQRLGLANLPARASVVIKSPRGLEHLVANSSGAATSRRVCCGARGPEFRWGATITLQATKPGYVGVLLKTKAVSSGLRVVRRLCIPARGGRAVRCGSAGLKGS